MKNELGNINIFETAFWFDAKYSVNAKWPVDSSIPLAVLNMATTRGAVVVFSSL